ncbi:MAG: pseudouridine synthase [Gammaproteobacteria bacterium]|nr:pseudouridine synthase [Gammaproteobacteria bacterium]
MPSHGVRLVEVGDEAGQRLDNFLLAIMKGVPRSRVYRMLRRGEVRVNGGRARPTYRVCRGDTVRVPPHRAGEPSAGEREGEPLASKEPSAGEREGEPLASGKPDSAIDVPQRLAAVLRDRVVYEDRDILVLDKPSGLAAHGGSGVSFGVIEILRRQDPRTRYELAHRLDRDTSGCLAVAKRRPALTALHEAFRTGVVHKRYDLVVSGRWPATRRTVRDALERYRLPNGERRVRVARGGDPARTDFAVVARRDDASADPATWLAATPRTGRTHQIRVHAAAAGHPIWGDDKYAPHSRGRLMLHATELTLPIADQVVRAAAPLPDEFARLPWGRT